MSHTTMNLNLKVWRQKNTKTPGAFEMYRVENISDEMSFLEMMDILNEQLITEGGASGDIVLTVNTAASGTAGYTIIPLPGEGILVKTGTLHGTVTDTTSIVLFYG